MTLAHHDATSFPNQSVIAGDSCCPCKQRLFTFCNDCHTSAVSSVSHIHKMIRDEDFDSVQDHLTPDFNDNHGDISGASYIPPYHCTNGSMILWECNTRQWTTMHYASSFHMSCSLKWWKWILSEATKEIRIRKQLLQHSKHMQKPQQIHTSDTLAVGTSLTDSSSMSYFRKPNDMGQTCIDLFFRHALYPLQWQKSTIHVRANQLRDALTWICYGEEVKMASNSNDACLHEHLHVVNYIRRFCCAGIKEIDTEDAMLTSISHCSFTHDEKQKVSIICQFWNRFMLFLDALVEAGELQGIPAISSRGDVILYQLANLGWCPRLVGHLAVLLHPNSMSADEEHLHKQVKQTSPLHAFLSTPSTRKAFTNMGDLDHHRRDNDGDSENNKERSYCYSYESDPGILPILLRAYPESIKVRDYVTERFPLQIALASLDCSSCSAPWDIPSTIQTLFDAYPDALYEIDPITKYPCFLLASSSSAGDRQVGREAESTKTTTSIHSQIELLAKQLLSSSSSTTTTSSGASSGAWIYLPRRLKEDVLRQAEDKFERQQLDITYQVLRQHPDAIYGCFMTC